MSDASAPIDYYGVRLFVQACFAVKAKWTIPSAPRTPAARPIRLTGSNELLRLLQPQAPPQVPNTTMQVVFYPVDPNWQTRAEEPDCPWTLTLNEIRATGLEQAHSPSSEDDCDRLRSAFSIEKRVQYLAISNEQGVVVREMIVYRDPLEIPINSATALRNLHSRRVGGRIKNEPKKVRQETRNGALTLCAVVSNVGDAGVKFESVYMNMKLGHPRFGRNLVLNWDTLVNLTEGTELNPRPILQWGKDPRYAHLPERDGANCLTDFQLSIPIERPDDLHELPARRWDATAFEGIQALKSVPRKSWWPFLRFMAGKKITSLESMMTNTAVIEAPEPRCKTGCGAKQNDDRDGQCYHGEYRNLTWVGPYLIFEIEVRGRPLWILDSPLYGVALRVYSDMQSAMNWAKGGALRVDDGSDPQLLKKLNHDPDGKWIVELTEVLATL